MKLVELGLHFGRKVNRFGLDALKVLPLGVVKTRHDHNPLPPLGADGRGLGLQFLGHQTVEQSHIGQIALMFRLEQIKGNVATRSLVRLKTDKQRAAVMGFDMGSGQGATNGVRVTRPAQGFKPNGFLRRVVVGHGEGHQLVERKFILPIKLHQARTDASEFQPLPYHGNADAETGGDFLHALAPKGQGMERLELVGGVHGQTEGIFDKADFASVLGIEDVTGDVSVFVELLLLGKKREGSEAPPARDHFKLALGARPHLQVLQEAVRGNAGGKFFDADRHARLTDVGRGTDKLVQGYHLDVHGKSPIGARGSAKAKRPRMNLCPSARPGRQSQGGDCRGGSPSCTRPRTGFRLVQKNWARLWKVGDTAIAALCAPGVAPLSNQQKELRFQRAIFARGIVTAWPRRKAARGVKRLEPAPEGRAKSQFNNRSGQSLAKVGPRCRAIFPD